MYERGIEALLKNTFLFIFQYFRIRMRAKKIHKSPLI